MSLSEFRRAIEEGPIPVEERAFMINGWRWHTASVIRDLTRFSKLVQVARENVTKTAFSSDSAEARESFARIQGSYEFVCNFNWKALIRVESDIFFPWLTTLLPSTANALIVDISSQHANIQELSGQISAICQRLVRKDGEVMAAPVALREINEIDSKLQTMMECARRIQVVQVRHTKHTREHL